MTIVKCQFCSAPLGKVYVTLIGPSEEDTFSICEQCWNHTETDGTRYHPSIHNDGPPK